MINNNPSDQAVNEQRAEALLSALQVERGQIQTRYQENADEIAKAKHGLNLAQLLNSDQPIDMMDVAKFQLGIK